MTTTAHSTTHPTTGATATRKSKTRTYTNAVWIQEPAELKRARAEGELAYSRTLAAKYAAVLAGTEAPTGRLTVESYAGYLENVEATIARLELELEADAYTDGEWGVAAWNGRLELSVREANKWASKGYRTTITDAVQS